MSDPHGTSHEMFTLCDMADSEMIRGWAEDVKLKEAELEKWRNWIPDDETLADIKEQATAKDGTYTNGLAASHLYACALEARLRQVQYARVMREEIARLFHETYERLAPDYSYKTRRASAVPWEDVPENNKQLMIAVVSEVLASIQADRDALIENCNETVLNYNELLFAVSTKHPEETRHETALRYIQEAEPSFCIESKSAQKEIEDGT